MARSSYKPEFNDLVIKLCLLGATDKEIADCIGVTETTINNWKLSQPSFVESLKQGKDLADARVAERLFQRAIGYEHDDIELKVVSLGNNKGSEVQQIKVHKYYPPDVTACIFWLKNRQKRQWREKLEGDEHVDWQQFNLFNITYNGSGKPELPVGSVIKEIAGGEIASGVDQGNSKTKEG